MQQYRDILINRGLLRRTDMANSPLHKAIFNMEEKRSNLFLDRRRIPGRKGKFLICLAVLAQFWGVKKVIEIKNFMKKRDQDMKKLNRRCAPFFQAMNDLRYCALEERKNMVIQELFAYKGQEYIQKLTTRFHQTEFWSPFAYRYTYMNNKTNRNMKPYTTLWFSRYLHGYDVYNI